MQDRERLRSALDALNRAVDDCADEDMRSEVLDDALSFVEAAVKKGVASAKSFRNALVLAKPWRRREAVKLAARRIRRWAETAT